MGGCYKARLAFLFTPYTLDTRPEGAALVNPIDDIGCPTLSLGN